MKTYNGHTLEDLDQNGEDALRQAQHLGLSEKEQRLSYLVTIAEACMPKNSVFDSRELHEAIARRLFFNFNIIKKRELAYAGQELLSLVSNVIGTEINHYFHSNPELSSTEPPK